jgi:tetratricopeptide (TPR) repeat protein
MLLSAGSCVITYLAQQGSGSVAIGEFPLGVRAANAVVSTVWYLLKMIVPADLAAFYPHRGITLPAWQVIGSTALLIGITALVIVRARRKPYLAIGWFWFVITLMPVIGLVQVGSQSMADRYTYVPLIGVFVALTWVIADGVGEWGKGRVGAKASPPRPLSPSPTLLIPAVLIIAACVVGTWRQTGYWKDEISLCRHALAVTRGNFMMHNNLGVALYDQGHPEAAIAEYRKALAIASTYADVHVNLGNAMSDLGKLDEAVAEYNKSIKANPKDPKVYNNLGAVLEQQQKIDEAISAYRKSIELDPNLAAPHGNLAHALLQLGQADEAVAEYRIAIDLEPSDPQAHLNLGEALRTLGSEDEAISEYSRALWIRPDYPEAHLDMGVALISQGKPDEAIEHYRQAISLRPDYAEAHHNLAIALYSKGDYAGAWQEIALCRKCGLTPHPGFIEVLSKAMPEPK